MKKLLLVLSLFISNTAIATTGTVLIRGYVPPIININVVATGNATNLNIISGDTVVVANITEISNSSTGYTIKASSVNASKLVNENVPGQTVDYTIAYGAGSPITLTGTPQTVKSVASQTNAVATSTTLTAIIPASSSKLSGYYSDTITVTIEAL